MKKIPMRMCVGCREMFPKKDLTRVVRSPEGKISIDRKGKASGRGAYLCSDPACLEKAQRSRALERALEAKIDEDVFVTLREQLCAKDEC